MADPQFKNLVDFAMRDQKVLLREHIQLTKH